VSSRLRALLLAVAAAASTAAAAQQLPWYEVPVVSGFTGNYTCVTQNVPGQGPVITCNPYRLNQMSPGAQTFLLAHEHGHVFQFRHGLQFSGNPEADADCYAAKYLAMNDPGALQDAIYWLQNVLGPNGGDMTHGSGFQVAAWALQCAGWN
jgi:hypothetical protein